MSAFLDAFIPLRATEPTAKSQSAMHYCYNSISYFCFYFLYYENSLKSSQSQHKDGPTREKYSDNVIAHTLKYTLENFSHVGRSVGV